MGNPFVSRQVPQQQQAQMPNFEQLYKQFAQNPWKYLSGLNLPSDIQTPEQAVRYLANNGQIPPLIQKQVYTMLGMK